MALTPKQIVDSLRRVASVHPQYVLEEVLLQLRDVAVPDIAQLLINVGILTEQQRSGAETQLLDYFVNTWLTKLKDAVDAEKICEEIKTDKIAARIDSGDITINDQTLLALYQRTRKPYGTGRL